LQVFFDELDADATTKENMGKKDKITDPLWSAIDKYYSSRTDSSCRSALSISITVLNSLMTSRRSHSVSKQCYIKYVPVDRPPEPITPRKRQIRIDEFLCMIHFWTIWLQNSLNRKTASMHSIYCPVITVLNSLMTSRRSHSVSKQCYIKYVPLLPKLW
jgi:hypothetical protein